MRRQELDALPHVQCDSPEIRLAIVLRVNKQTHKCLRLTATDQVVNWLCDVGQSLYVLSF